MQKTTTVQTLERKIAEITNDQTPFISKILLEMAKKNPENAKIICDYIVVEQNEINIASNTKGDKIKRLEHLSRHYFHYIDFKQMDKEQIQHYLNTLKKHEKEDPHHKSYTTYNNRYNIFLKFFKWLHFPNKLTKERKTPKCMKGIKTLQRNEISSYTPYDMWQDNEAAMFLKYCNDSRDKCYMAMAYESSGRPHELLKLKFKDLKIKEAYDGTKIAYTTLYSNKRGVNPRDVGFAYAIPYLKDWRNEHPFGANEDAYIFISRADRNKMNLITRDGLYKRFNEYYRKNYFQKILDDETVPIEDKNIIKKMFDKPWNLYVQRHSSLTYIAKNYKPGDQNLRIHGGWTPNSKMPELYMHYFGNETANMFLEQKGIQFNKDENDPLKFIKCPQCNESNKPTNTSCSNCKLVLKMDAFYKKIENDDKLDRRLIKLEFNSWIDEYEKEKILQIKKDVEKELMGLRQTEPNNLYGHAQDKIITISIEEQVNAFKAYYKDLDLTDEHIESLQIKPRNIMVHQVKSFGTKGNVFYEGVFDMDDPAVFAIEAMNAILKNNSKQITTTQKQDNSKNTK